ncbi:MAG: RNA methyltransferase [Actinobacteria bacterium]|nr:RNA methyltransferase [Actinomycetota bacterium]
MSDAHGPRHPGVRALRALARDPRARADVGACLLEGPRVITAALDRGAALEAVYCGPGAARAFPDVVARCAAVGVPVHDLKEGVLERIGTTRTPQPVLAVARFGPAALDVVVAAARDRSALVVVGVSDPGNLGTILRSAEAAGLGGVVVAGDAVDVRSPKVVRASAGSVFGLPVAVVPDALPALGALRAAGVVTVGAVARGGDAPDGIGLGRGAALVLGNEAHGLDPALTAAVDRLVTVPMAGPTESLNVAMAATVLCFEAARQRAASERGVGA